VTDAEPDPVGEVDAHLGALVPGLRPPAIRRRHVVLVTGPWLAGSSGLVAELRARRPDLVFVEADELRRGQAPVAVVFVVSAAAPMTASDCAVLDAAAAWTDLVIGVVSKIDVHRGWRDALEADRATLQAHAERYRQVPWVGVAAAPELGDPQCDELLGALDAGLDDDMLYRRNRLRAWESRLETAIREHDNAAAAAGREARMDTLRAERTEALRDGRVTKSERVVALRSQMQQARVQLSYFARNRCASVRGELQEDAAAMTRRRLSGFEHYTRQRVAMVLDEVDEGVTEHLADIANELGLPSDPSAPARPSWTGIGRPPLKPRRLETRLMTLLGAGFGLGVALTLSRLFADLAPGLTVVGAVVCALVGVAVTVWLVNTRGLLHDRAVLDRWVGEVVAGLRATADQLVATRVLATEMAMTSALNHQIEAQGVRTAERVRAIDAELREHTDARSRAAAARERETPALLRALDAVHDQLAQPPEARTGRVVTAGATESAADLTT